jgi:hypothetical protein
MSQQKKYGTQRVIIGERRNDCKFFFFLKEKIEPNLYTDSHSLFPLFFYLVFCSWQVLHEPKSLS